MKNFFLYFTFGFMASLTVTLGFLLNDNNDSLLDESIVSAGAFLMLIFATILQLHELSAQRDDLKLTRKEMRQHSKEFNKANDLTTETLNQTKFFELLRLKEEYSNVILSSKNNLFNDFNTDYKKILHDEICDVVIKEMNLETRQKIIEDNNLKNKYTKQRVINMSPQNEQDFYNEKIFELFSSINIDLFLSEILLKYNVLDTDAFSKVYISAKSNAHRTHIGKRFEKVNTDILKPYFKHKTIIELIDENENLISLYNSQLHIEEKEAYKILDDSLELDDTYFRNNLTNKNID
ncbi:hypothetical protein [Salinicoccus roseus]|uniref:Phage abortive infection protein n=1 Tax=Salinicoccus roseus TaxID=45670 RepID=A0A0C2HB36_9STAP|nr:hypothetical protein [Salinicoccus roseus]KIH70945.1 hypothetical protein SN16_05145 [Salinicoccus roseus]MDB0580170.1 hypothetical protein [Salinicoccus roseus]